MRVPLRSEAARALANLAIELGDPGRMAKARRLYRSGAVSAVDFDKATAYASVTDSNGDIYEVELRVQTAPANANAPGAEDISVTCSCDDSAEACRHALATVLAIAEQVEINPRTLQDWTSSQAEDGSSSDDSPRPAVDADFFIGQWRTPHALPVLRRMTIAQPSLVVEDIDAGPMVAAATEAIVQHLRR